MTSPSLVEVVRRLEALTVRLEALAERLEPKAEALDPPPEEMEKAQEFIEESSWRTNETIRRWQDQGGPTDEDAEAYFNAWTLYRS